MKKILILGANGFIGHHLTLRILRSRVLHAAGPPQPPTLVVDDVSCVAHCGGGGTLLVKDVEVDGVQVTPRGLAAILGTSDVGL